MCPEHNPDQDQPLKPRFQARTAQTDLPALHFISAEGETQDSALAMTRAVSALRAGKIIAVKTVNGYRLMCDARNDIAITRLRSKISRPHEPFTVVFPASGADGLNAVRASVDLTNEQARILNETDNAIVLAQKKSSALISPRLAPNLKEIGVSLPPSPLQKILLDGFAGPLATLSASAQSVLTNDDLPIRLTHVAEAFLNHDSPFETAAEGNVFRLLAGQARPVYWGRGNAILELPLPFTLKKPLIAVGASTQNTVALAYKDRVLVSPFIGDLDLPSRLTALEKIIAEMQEQQGIRVQHIACDAHLASIGTRWARRTGWQVVPIFHHYAHAAALAAEHPDVERWLTFTWDGMGYGMDGTFWGGEALLGRPGEWERVGSWRPFRLVGGEKSRQEPWRAAASLCWEAGIKWNGCLEDITLAQHAWQRGLNSPAEVVAGSLFNAAAALIGLNYRSSYSGQGPMLLEAACGGEARIIKLPLARNRMLIWELDWSPLLPFLMNGRISIAERALGFHASLAQALLSQARAVREEQGHFTIGLHGSVFQNRVLLEQAIMWLAQDGFDVRLAHRMPANNASISLGQILEAQIKLL